MGLKPNHHAELNQVNISPDRFAELRKQYKDDAVALQQIDVYDGSTEYQDKIRKFRNALKSGDTRAEGKLAHWFRKH